jgi:NAD+ kinase
MRPCRFLQENKMMDIALFGRNVGKESFPELGLLFQRLKSDARISLAFYKPFYNYLIDSIKQTEAKISGSFAILNAVEGADLFTGADDIPSGTELFLSLGGDGTFLNGVALVRDRNIPIAGINFGHLGFLTTASVADKNTETDVLLGNEWIDKLLNREFTTEKRSLLKMDFEHTPADFYPCALNEISIQRNGTAMLDLEISVNGTNLPRYPADGVVVSTATGSTAYALSVGGPIVMPQSNVLLIVPIAPHNLNIRPLVVPDTSIIGVSFSGRNKDALVSADNRFFHIPTDSKIKISKGTNSVNMVSMDNNFIKALNEKLFWGADKRNLK